MHRGDSLTVARRGVAAPGHVIGERVGTAAARPVLKKNKQDHMAGTFIVFSRAGAKGRRQEVSCRPRAARIEWRAGGDAPGFAKRFGHGPAFPGQCPGAAKSQQKPR